MQNIKNLRYSDSGWKLRAMALQYIVWLVCFLTCNILPNTVFGQHQELQEKPSIWQPGGEKNLRTDTANLLHAFRRGRMNGHIRYYFSYTDNEKSLTDYFAHALGGGIRFESSPWHGFQAGVSGFYIFHLGSSDLGEKDAVALQGNRYEVGLFDVTDPTNTSEINRLEELFIKYSHNHLTLTAGRQLLNTPFINLQDGRMRPTAAQGLWAEYKAGTTHAFQGGWINGMAPRGTRRWYNLASSVGLYSVGLHPDGTRSGYPGQVQSHGAALAGYSWKPSSSWTSSLWHIWVENVMHTSFAQGEWSPSGAAPFKFACQTMHQRKSGTGGNTDPQKAYFTNQGSLWTAGFRVTTVYGKWEHSIAGNAILGNGRYLMPREWGRDPFFTFLPRERNEGAGKSISLLWKTKYEPSGWGTLHLAAGYYRMPAVDNVSFNKYGIPSYMQYMLDYRYRFSRQLAGWELQVLYTRKQNATGESLSPSSVFNKVNMHLLNVVVNFHFQ